MEVGQELYTSHCWLTQICNIHVCCLNMACLHGNDGCIICRFHSLTRESDGEEYSAKVLLSARVHDFKLVVLTQLFALPKDFMEHFYVIRIHISDLK